MKASPTTLIRAHYGTLVDIRDNRHRWQDHALFEGLPFVLASGVGAAEIKLPAGASAGLLTVAGLLSAFLFGTMLQVADRAMSWADDPPPPSAERSSHAEFLEGIAANAGYASLVSIATAAMFVVATVVTGPALIVFSALGLGLALHVALMLLLVMTNVFALIQGRLIRGRTRRNPAPVTPLEQRRAHGK